MALDAQALADKLKNSLGFSQFPTSKENNGFAKAYVSEITSLAKVNNIVGTITGVCAPGSPLSAGAGIGGIISGPSGPTLAAKIQSEAGYPYISPELLKFSTAVTDHLKTGIVVFAPGTITGTCTNTAESPGPLTGGAGSGGKITLLSGPTLAQLLSQAIGESYVSPQLLQFAITLVTYTMTMAEVAYASGTVVGLCPSGGGPLSAGVGLNGIIA